MSSMDETSPLTANERAWLRFLRDVSKGTDPAQIADLLNEKGLRTLHGKVWNKSRVRQPVSRARQILRAEESMKQAADPRFGMF